MKIAYLCHRFPYPPNKGDKIRAFHQIRAIASRHQVDLFALVDDPADLVHRQALSAYCHTINVARLHPRFARLLCLPFLLTRKPLTLPIFYSGELHAHFRAAVLTRNYDRIVVYCSAMAQYTEDTGDTPVITDLVDVDSDKWRQYAAYHSFPVSSVYRREHKCLSDYERRICERSASVVVTTDREARLAQEICADANVHVIPNGVDTTYFERTQVRPVSRVPTLIFTGDMSYFPNEEAVCLFVRNILPLVRDSVPEVQFLVVGRNPSRKVRQLQEVRGVEVTGFVPDIRPYLAKAWVSVAPFSIAAGIQNKTLEAMAYGLPVVGTTRAVQGLSPGAASIVETSDVAEEFAAKVVRLLQEPDLALCKGAEGRSRVSLDYNWRESLEQFLHLLENPTQRETTRTRVSHV